MVRAVGPPIVKDERVFQGNENQFAEYDGCRRWRSNRAVLAGKTAATLKITNQPNSTMASRIEISVKL